MMRGNQKRSTRPPCNAKPCHATITTWVQYTKPVTRLPLFFEFCFVLTGLRRNLHLSSMNPCWIDCFFCFSWFFRLWRSYRESYSDHSAWKTSILLQWLHLQSDSEVSSFRVFWGSEKGLNFSWELVWKKKELVRVFTVRLEIVRWCFF